MISEDLVREISAIKQEPEWMLELRFKGMRLFNKLPMPEIPYEIFGETGVDLDNLEMYVKPKQDTVKNWKDVPKEIRETFKELGIPEAERAGLAGVGAQYDSEMVYHNIREELTKLGVVYMPMDEAVRDSETEEIVRKHFMKLVKPDGNKLAAMHLALHSGGSFIYVPKGMTVSIPLNSYYRLNAPGAGQFEHTIVIVDEGADVHFIEGCSAPKYNVANLHVGCVEMFVQKNARLKFSAVVNWSKNLYNLTMKRAKVLTGGELQWVSGVFGSRTSVLKPTIELAGRGAKAEYTGVSLAGGLGEENCSKPSGQILDTGVRIVHQAPETYSTINSKSISKDCGRTVTHTLVEIKPEAVGSKSYTNCKALIMDNESQAEAIPEVKVGTSEADVVHEASVGKVSSEAVLYLRSRGMSEEEATRLLVRGFMRDVVRELPLEYAKEMNDLLGLEMKNA
ncbi:MAG: Fe-S cluster assembly protein SufB [Candidatus Saccharibacteria bacterium]|nr:Fe-S cluster assembly protein SufB [Candidatus Saccharibacteria bacterium]